MRPIAFVDLTFTSSDLAGLLQADFWRLSFGILCQQKCVHPRLGEAFEALLPRMQFRCPEAGFWQMGMRSADSAPDIPVGARHKGPISRTPPLVCVKQPRTVSSAPGVLPRLIPEVLHPGGQRRS